MWGDKGQGPIIDLEFYVSAVKIDAYGSRASQAQYKLIHHVNMQFNKIPTISYAMQQEMGAWFLQGIGREIIQTLERIVLIQMSMREPIKSQLPILSYAPNHLILPEVGWGS